MSLLLRKAGQTILDQHKIPNYHVGINDHNQMVIQSECGKPFITIVGIQFNRSTPSAEEVTYATELLDGYMATHIQTIKAYIKAQATFQRKKEPAFNKKFEVYIEFDGYNNKTGKRIHQTQLTYKDNIIRIRRSTSGTKVTMDTSLINDKQTLTKIAAWKQDKALKKEADKYLKDHQAYRKERHDLQQLKVKLSACNI